MQPINYNIPSNIGGAGNVTLDPMPYVKYALDVQARNQAKQDAVIKSFQNATASATTKGMDSQDVNSFLQKKQDWMDFILKNKDAYENVAKDGGNVYGQAMTKYNDMLAYSQASIDKLKAASQAASAMADPKKRSLMTEEAMQNYHNALLPLDDKNYQQWRPDMLDYNPPPFDGAQQTQVLNQLRSTIRPSLTGDNNITYGTPVIDAATHTKTTPFTRSLSQDDYKVIGSLGANLYGRNAGVKDFFDKELNNPQDYQRYNEIYKNHFGKDANIKSGEDMATSFLLSNLVKDLKGQKQSSYTPPKAASASASANGSNTPINDLYKEITDKLNDPSKPNGVPLNEYSSAAQEAILQVANKLNPSKTKFGQKDIYVGHDASGNPAILRAHSTLPLTKRTVAPLDYKSVNLLAASGVKQKQQVIANAQSLPKQTSGTPSAVYKAANGKTYSHNDLKKLGYTEEQIQQAIKLGNLK